MNHISQAGLITKWLKDTAFVFDLEYNFHYDRVLVVGDIVLNLRHLEVSFWLLGFGFGIAFIVFVGEIFAATYYNRKRCCVAWIESLIQPTTLKIKSNQMKLNIFFYYYWGKLTRWTSTHKNCMYCNLNDDNWICLFSDRISYPNSIFTKLKLFIFKIFFSCNFGCFLFFAKKTRLFVGFFNLPRTSFLREFLRKTKVYWIAILLFQSWVFK